MVSLPTSSDEEYEYEEEDPFEYEHKGFPEGCFCGGEAILEKKRTGPDAGRLYYRCSSHKNQDNTAHLGKWFDKAVEEEWQIMRKDISRLESRARVDGDYVERLCFIEASHKKMKSTVEWLAEQVDRWEDEVNIKGVALLEKQMARERLWSRIVAILSLRTNRSAVAVAVVVLTSFVLGWRLREFV